MSKIKNIVGNKYGRLTVLEDDGTRTSGGNVYWKCQCECGNIIHATKSSLEKEEVKSCGCYRQELRKKQKGGKDLTNQRFGKLIALYPLTQRYHRQVVWHCKCDCGNEKDIPSNSLLSGDTKSCGCNSHPIADITNQKFGLLTALYPTNERNSNHVMWYCKCECGKNTLVTVNNLKSGNAQSCGCQQSSLNINKIENYFIKNHIFYEKEKKFNECKDKKFLPFDFFINNQYIIEYDGSQHFCKDNFFFHESTHQHDLIKNQYCFKNNIPLIRIPYDAEYTIDDLKLETTKFLLTPENEELYYLSHGYIEPSVANN